MTTKILPFHQAADLTKKQLKQVEYGVAEKICSEIGPCLFHDSDDRAWIRLPFDDHYETYPVDGEEMREFLRRQYWNDMKEIIGYGMVMQDSELKDRIARLRARALYEGPEYPAFLRTGENERILYIDLCDRKEAP